MLRRLCLFISFEAHDRLDNPIISRLFFFPSACVWHCMTFMWMHFQAVFDMFDIHLSIRFNEQMESSFHNRVECGTSWTSIHAYICVCVFACHHF